MTEDQAPESPMSPAASDAASPAPAAPAAPPEPAQAAPVPVPENPAGAAGAPSVKVRLLDVSGHVEHFFATHPALDRALLTELKSGLMALERFA